MSSIARRYYSNQDDMLHAINYGFLKVLQSLEKFDPDKNLATWIRIILVNHIIDEYRKQKKHLSSIHVQYDEEIEEQHFEYSHVEKKWEEHALREMLSELNEMSRTVFNLFAIDGFSHKEIAIKLSISSGTSKWHVSQARTKLKALMDTREGLEKKIKRTPNER